MFFTKREINVNQASHSCLAYAWPLFYTAYLRATCINKPYFSAIFANAEKKWNGACIETEMIGGKLS